MSKEAHAPEKKAEHPAPTKSAPHPAKAEPKTPPKQFFKLGEGSDA